MFVGLPCRSYEEMANDEQCTASGPSAVMGTADPATLRLARGVYYTRTNPQAPYAINSSGVIDDVFNV